MGPPWALSSRPSPEPRVLVCPGAAPRSHILGRPTHAPPSLVPPLGTWSHNWLSLRPLGTSLVYAGEIGPGEAGWAREGKPVGDPQAAQTGAGGLGRPACLYLSLRWSCLPAAILCPHCQLASDLVPEPPLLHHKPRIYSAPAGCGQGSVCGPGPGGGGSVCGRLAPRPASTRDTAPRGEALKTPWPGGGAQLPGSPVSFPGGPLGGSRCRSWALGPCGGEEAKGACLPQPAPPCWVWGGALGRGPPWSHHVQG